MKLYLDLIFLINIWFDFLILLTISILLKRNVKFRKIILGSLFGGITIFILFLNLNNIALTLLKFLVSILIVIITFSFKNLKYTLSNLGYFYLTSIILGGGMYLVSDSFMINKGLIFKNNGFSFNYIILFFLSIIIIVFYLKQSLKLKNNYSNYHKVDILYKDKLYHLNGYLDTGNNLFDPYKKRNIILVKLNLDYNMEDIIYTPFKTLNNHSILKCLKIDKLYVDQQEFKNYLIGLATDDFQLEGIKCILHNSMKGKLK